MDKLNDISLFIAHYGYLAIFLCVFFQELGVPNPVTNEVILMFGGYLSFLHTLSIYKVIFVAIAADVSGTSILFFTFYFFGKWLLKHKPQRLPTKTPLFHNLKQYVNKRGKWSIFVGRLTPFLRGYISIAAGMLHIKPKKFLTTVTFSAITWSGGLVFLGWLLAPYWDLVLKNAGVMVNVVFILILIIAITLTGRYFVNRNKKVYNPIV